MHRSLLIAVAVCAAAAVARAQTPDEPIGFHHAQWLAHQDGPTNPDFVNGPVIMPRAAGVNPGPCRIVFGYLPYWETSGVANIQWDKLTHLGAFAIDINELGNITNYHSWPWSSIVNTAHAYGVKVHLVVTLFDGAKINTLINSPTNKANFFQNVRNQVIAGNADGVNIDFESGSGWQSQIDEFMGELSAYLDAEIPGCETSIATAAVNWSGSWQFGNIVQNTDIVFIMGYAFWGSWSTTSGPEAPLAGGTYNITNTVVSQYASARAIAPQKLVLGVPYYGEHWTTQTSAARSTVIDWLGAIEYQSAQAQSQTYGLQWETASQTPWYRYQSSGVWHQVWFDNAQSLGLKYDLVDNYNLGGVGMWALNYDGSRPELWNLIEERYVEPCCEGVNLTYGVFADDFDDGAAASRWSLYATSTDHTADFFFDYSQNGIPSAPNSTGGTTRGLKLTVNNNDGNPSVEAVSLYPSGEHFTSDYALKFDMWINYNGGSGGGTGSTEFAIAGVGLAGDRVVWSNNPASDGMHFWVSGEGGAAEDYRAYSDASMYTAASGVYPAGSQAASAQYYLDAFPSPTYETPGAPGKRWVEVEVRRLGASVYWFINGRLLANVATGGSDGNVLIGYADVFSSLAIPAADNYLIVDNVRVELVADDDCNANGISDACENIALGDFDADGDSGAADLNAFTDCLAGPGDMPTPSNAACAGPCLAAFDFDGDQDLDLVDFYAFQDVVQPN